MCAREAAASVDITALAKALGCTVGLNRLQKNYMYSNGSSLGKGNTCASKHPPLLALAKASRIPHSARPREHSHANSGASRSLCWASQASRRCTPG